MVGDVLPTTQGRSGMKPAPDGGRNAPQESRSVATALYIGCVILLATALFSTSVRRDGLNAGTDFAILSVLGIGFALQREVRLEGRQLVSLWSVLLLSCQALVGPAGAGLLGAVMGLLQGRGLKARNRIFNSAQASAIGSLGGWAFVATHGTNSVQELGGVGQVLMRLAVPLFVADIVQFTANIALLTGVVIVSRTGSLRTVTVPLLRGTGLAYVGYGVIAFFMVVLWVPAGLGPASTLLVLAPLLVAQWAYRQHAEELKGQDRVLQVLVAAVEAKAPHLVSHSDRVAALSADIAERLGLAPQLVADVRMAGMLHDVGQTILPTTLVRQAVGGGRDLADYPRRGVEVLSGLGFLRGALEPIADHHEALDHPGGATGLAARVVGIADEYDLLTEIGTPDGRRLEAAEAMDRLRERPGVDERLLGALGGAVARRTGVVAG